MTSLVVDVGNTSTAIAVARDLRVSRVKHIAGAICPKTIESAIGQMLPAKPVDGSVLASVVPSVTKNWIRILKRITGTAPLVVDHKINLGVDIDYPRPKTIGPDRLANACGAVALYGAPVIVADFGTALTFDIVSEKKTYIGGVIAPGLPLMTDYLADKTALLPHIRLHGPARCIGRSTKGAMRIGARIGYRGMVREIVGHIAEALEITDVNLCATGGFAGWALKGLDMPFVIEPNLTLAGLGRIFELNKGLLLNKSLKNGLFVIPSEVEGSQGP